MSSAGEIHFERSLITIRVSLIRGLYLSSITGIFNQGVRFWFIYSARMGVCSLICHHPINILRYSGRMRCCRVDHLFPTWGSRDKFKGVAVEEDLSAKWSYWAKLTSTSQTKRGHLRFAAIFDETKKDLREN
jgi:hypothetical protein